MLFSLSGTGFRLMAGKPSLVPAGRIERAILLIRGQKVMLDADLAELYRVSVGRLNEAVKRNRSRLPDDFMFQLTREEFAHLKSQIAISSSGWGSAGRPRCRPPPGDSPSPLKDQIGPPRSKWQIGSEAPTRHVLARHFCSFRFKNSSQRCHD